MVDGGRHLTQVGLQQRIRLPIGVAVSTVNVGAGVPIAYSPDANDILICSIATPLQAICTTHHDSSNGDGTGATEDGFHQLISQCRVHSGFIYLHLGLLYSLNYATRGSIMTAARRSAAFQPLTTSNRLSSSGSSPAALCYAPGCLSSSGGP